ncbi:recombinase family protein [Rathayibacter sp. VKM Ac-2857]|uniref:recombinase family protein n=1 Tax=Rathayibacter sp. VKM Ac-2857 TaxID=2739020 RepID=UPI001564EB2E|nr:recombinase family protein [Rathayibacter sp. VKM Ac-2857]NQX15083.1 recombinase family protein [Rathayibacter sp. VKM Ac-2857]
MGSVIGYARVSTSDQNAQMQVDALEAAGATRIYVDQGVSGMKASRPELDLALDRLKKGDVLLVWRLDRLGRGTVNTLTLIDSLIAKGVGFRSITEGLDSTTPTGKAMLGMVSIFAELERETIRERTSAGLAAAKAQGRTGGRPRALDNKKIKLAQHMYDSGEHTKSEIASTLGVGVATVYRYLGAAKK